jgi:transcriptional regulator with PAS, ATPase and Fis domain
MERAVILSSDNKINLSDLPPELSDINNLTERGMHISASMTMEQIELYVIKRALKKNNGNKNAVADGLGISLRTIYRKLDQSAN